jgi:anti-sigma regulatory factor (Ser/Thr protein kinase)
MSRKDPERTTGRSRNGLRLVSGTVVDLRYDHVPAIPEPLIELRHALTQWAHRAGVSAERTQDIALVTHEAMANAVTHAYANTAGGTFDLCASYDGGAVRVRIADRGHWQPPVGDPGTRHGMTIMRALRPEVTVTLTPHGTTVHLRWSAIVQDVSASATQRFSFDEADHAGDHQQHQTHD